MTYLILKADRRTGEGAPLLPAVREKLLNKWLAHQPDLSAAEDNTSHHRGHLATTTGHITVENISVEETAKPAEKLSFEMLCEVFGMGLG